jgi:hypothetical protein
MVQGDVVFMLVLWTVVDFHAYPATQESCSLEKQDGSAQRRLAGGAKAIAQ